MFENESILTLELMVTEKWGTEWTSVMTMELLTGEMEELSPLSTGFEPIELVLRGGTEVDGFAGRRQKAKRTKNS